MSKRKTSDLELTEISQKLKKALKNSHLSQNELAEKTNIPIGTLRSYLSGNRCPSYDNAVKIAESLGVGVGAFLSSEQKKHENKSKSDTFLRKNGVYVSLLRSLNFRCDVVYNDNLGIKCNISTKNISVDDDRYRYLRNRVWKYESCMDDSKYTDDEITAIYEEYYEYIHAHTNSMIMDADSEEWQKLKKEISSAVKEIVNKHIDAAVAEREKRQKEKIHQDTVSDLLKTLDAVKTVLPVLSESGSVDGETLKTLQTISEKYKH